MSHTGTPLLLLLLPPRRSPPPKMAPYCAPRVSIAAMIPAELASVITSTSLCATWESSWASTPSISSAVSLSRIPVVTQTAEWLADRPVANAFGMSV